MDSDGGGWNPDGLTSEDLQDGEAYHQSLYSHGDVTAPLSWHKDSITPLISLAMESLSDGAVVVDYGTGTGGSAVELLKACDNAGISINLTMIDPLPSWFQKAHSLLAHRDDVRFELSLSTNQEGRRVFRTLDEMLGSVKADLIVCSSTFHLVPRKALNGLMREMYGALAPGGALVWSSGDIHDSQMPTNRALLHDPYRAVREQVRDNEDRISALHELDEDARIRCEKVADSIFPQPPDISMLIDAAKAAGFDLHIDTEEISMSFVDAERFILVPRLAEVASPLPAGEHRDALICSALEVVFASMQASNQADDKWYRIHWTYGKNRVKTT